MGTRAGRPALLASTARPMASSRPSRSSDGVRRVAALIMKADQVADARGRGRRFAAAARRLPPATDDTAFPDGAGVRGRRARSSRWSIRARISSSVAIHWMPAYGDRRRQCPARPSLPTATCRPGRVAEQLLVELDGPVDVQDRRPRCTSRGAWAACSRASPAGPIACPTTAAESDDRTGVVVSSTCPDSASSLCSGMTCLRISQLLVEQPGLFGLGPELRPCCEIRRSSASRFEDQVVNPGQIAPDLQVAEVARREAPHGVLDRVDAEAPLQVQLVIPRVRADHAVDVRHEEIVEQIVHVDSRDMPSAGMRETSRCRSLPSLFGVALQLQQQAGHQVDRAAELGHFLEVQRHADSSPWCRAGAPRASASRPRRRRGSTAGADARGRPE